MFSFPQYLPQDQGLSKSQEWALALSLHDRLSAYGFSVRLCTIKESSGKKVPAVDLGNEIITSTGAADPHDVDYLERKQFVDASTWNGVESNALQGEDGYVNAIISQSVEQSIQQWLNSGASKDPKYLLERRLFGLQQKGFDVHKVFFHETESSKVDSLLENGFDLSLVSARDRDPSVPDGAFLKPNPVPIDVAEDPVQVPFLLKKGEVKTFRDREAVIDFMNSTPALQSLWDGFELMNETYDKEADGLIEKLKVDPKSQKLCESFDILLGRWRVEGSIKAAEIRQAFTDIIKQSEYRCVRVENDEGTWGRTVESTIALFPEDIAPADLSRAPEPVIKPKAVVSQQIEKKSFSTQKQSRGPEIEEQATRPCLS